MSENKKEPTAIPNILYTREAAPLRTKASAELDVPDPTGSLKDILYIQCAHSCACGCGLTSGHSLEDMFTVGATPDMIRNYRYPSIERINREASNELGNSEASKMFNIINESGAMPSGGVVGASGFLSDLEYVWSIPIDGPYTEEIIGGGCCLRWKGSECNEDAF